MRLESSDERNSKLSLNWRKCSQSCLRRTGNISPKYFLYHAYDFRISQIQDSLSEESPDQALIQNSSEQSEEESSIQDSSEESSAQESESGSVTTRFITSCKKLRLAFTTAEGAPGGSVHPDLSLPLQGGTWMVMWG